MTGPGLPAALVDVLPVAIAERHTVRGPRGGTGDFAAALRAAGRGLLIDEHGFRTGSPDLDTVKRFEGKSLWYDPGRRYDENAMDAFVAGAERVVVSSRGLEEPEQLLFLAELSDQLVAGLHLAGSAWRGTAPWRNPEEAVSGAVAAGIEDFLFWDAEGAAPGGPVAQLARRAPRAYVGVVAGADVAAWEGTGVAGVVVDFAEVPTRKS